jgi:hypothetical protein
LIAAAKQRTIKRFRIAIDGVGERNPNRSKLPDNFVTPGAACSAMLLP